MARSRKKTPIHSYAAESDKPYKKFEHGRERSKVKQILRTTEDYDDLALPHKEEFGEPWNSPKDGKGYWQRPGEQDSGWSKKYWEKLMRK